MAKKINTLSRWNLITKRIKEAADRLEQENITALESGRHIDADTFSVRKEALKAAVAKAVGEQTELYFSMKTALFSIRRALAHANVAKGVSDLLAQQEEAKQTITYYNHMMGTAAGTLSLAEVEALVARKKAASNGNTSSSRYDMYNVDVTFLSAEQLASLTEKRDAAQRLAYGLADSVSDANASKLEIDIADDVVKALGL